MVRGTRPLWACSFIVRDEDVATLRVMAGCPWYARIPALNVLDRASLPRLGAILRERLGL